MKKVLSGFIAYVVFGVLLHPLSVFATESSVLTETVSAIPDDAVEYSGHYYKFFSESMRWSDAKAKCEQLGGHLVTITSQEEQDFIISCLNSLDSKNMYWIGLQETSRDKWSWITDESYAFSNWAAGEPNNDFGGSESVVQIFGKEYNYIPVGKWNDSRNDSGNTEFFGLSKTGFICEWDGKEETGGNNDKIGYELSPYRTTFFNNYRGNNAGSADIEFDWGWSLFEQDPAQYDHRIAMASLLLSNVVYDNEEKIRKQFKGLGFSDTDTKLKLYNFTEDTFRAPATAISSQTYTVDGNEKTIISVVVRGTQNGADGWTDVLDGGLCEFAVSASSVYKWLEDYCNENNIILNDENTILFITGHSLGGAVAGRLEFELKLDHINAKMYVYTIAAASFASPLELMGDHSCVHNIINTGDFVPKIPPWFLHFGNLYWYDPGDEKFAAHKIDMYGNDEEYVKDGKITDFLFEHQTATYLYCMLTELPYYSFGNTLKDYMNIIVRCPVDVQVLDAKGNIVGYTEGQMVKNNNIELAIIMLNGDEKYIYLPANSSCTIKMFGTGEGVMEYSVQSYNEYMESIETKVFNNINLGVGKVFQSVVSPEIETSNIQLWVLDENEDIIAEVMEDGQEIPSNLDESTCNITGVVFSPGGISDPITVQLIDSNNNIVAETSTADNGTSLEYELSNLKKGIYVLKASSKNYVTREYSLVVSGDMTQDIEIHLIGDVTGDGKVDAADKLSIYKCIEGGASLDGYDFLVGDVTNDGKINMADKLGIYKHIEGSALLWK